MILGDPIELRAQGLKLTTNSVERGHMFSLVLLGCYVVLSPS
jgi:hypothetical protein